MTSSGPADIGITVLSGGDIIATVDVVAVHGLNSSPKQCWSQGDKLWLRDFLPEDVPKARILVFGYNSNIIDEASRARIRDHAKNLLQDLADVRKENASQRPIVFICHSLGGIIVKQALVMTNIPHSRFEGIKICTYGILFLGTPHRGSLQANMGQIMANLARVAFKSPKTQLLKSLERDSHGLDTLSEEFSRLHSTLKVISFYEQKETKIGVGVWGMKSISLMIVDETSAKLNIDREIQVPLNASHSELAKFTSKENNGYKRVMSRVQELVEEAPEAIAERFMPTCTSGIKDSRSHPTPPIFVMPLYKNPDFVGREDELKQLANICGPGIGGGEQVRAALWGLGGIGKTTIAVEFCYRRIKTNPRAHIFWVHGNTQETFKASYLRIGQAAALSMDNDEEEGLQRVKRWLSSPESGDWVLVIDNFDNPSDLTPKKYIPVVRGTILFTTRNRRLIGPGAYVREKCGVEIKQMSDTEALDTFFQLLGGGEADEAGVDTVAGLARQLMLHLENLPLAIAQAAAYINIADISISDYLELFMYEHSKLLCERLEATIEEEEPESRAVMTTWKVTVDKIRSTDPKSLLLLEVMCFYNPEEIPEYLLRGVPFLEKGSLVDFRNALNTLVGFSLLYRIRESSSCRLHRLVSLYMRTEMELERKHVCLQTAVDLVYQNIPNDGLGNMRKCMQLKPHAVSVLEHGICNVGSRSLGELYLYNALGSIASAQGEYVEALKWYQQALEGLEMALGKEHPKTLNIVNNMANVFLNKGDYSMALEWHQRALEGKEKTLGKEHPSTLDTVHNIAGVFGDQGDYSTALEWYQRALEGKEKTLGKEHPSTLGTVNNMASVFRNKGDYSMALEWYQRALEGKEKTLGKEHPSTLDTVHNMAGVFGDQGDYSTALEWYQQALEGEEKTLGKEHPSTIANKNMVTKLSRKVEKAQLAPVHP